MTAAKSKLSKPPKINVYLRSDLLEWDSKDELVAKASVQVRPPMSFGLLTSNIGAVEPLFTALLIKFAGLTSVPS